MKVIITLVFAVFIAVTSFAQADTTAVKKENKGFLSLFEEPPGLNPSPRKAMLLSLAFPGAGQVYNKKQWYIRAPIATGLVGGGVYFYIASRQQYLTYRNELRKMVAGEPSIFDDNPRATQSLVRDVRDQNRKLMEQALFGTIGVYLLNGIEAFSTAHLLNFDVSEDLSFQFEPSVENAGTGSAVGFGVTIQPKFNQPQPVDWLK